jgi:hypothetical protein
VRYNNISVSISSSESDSELRAMSSAVAHFARLQETTSHCALTLCYALFPVLRLPVLRPLASQYALTPCHAVFHVLRLPAWPAWPAWPALRPPASRCAPGLKIVSKQCNWDLRSCAILHSANGGSIAHRFETAQWPHVLGPDVQCSYEEEEDAITRYRNFVQIT